jgi:hypothetical protein
VRILIRPRWPVFALLLLAPSIPELLTGSTPVSNLFFDPPAFGFGFGLDIALYGTGALLIREYVAAYRKGWASVLFLGAAYGIAEEGFEVHTFFQPSGSPVGALGSYGHFWGVNWLWALGLTVFHATYSIALPILLTQLWYPRVKDARWLDRGSIALVAGIFVFEVAGFGSIVGHGPSPAALTFFLVLAAALILLATRVPADLLALRPGPRRIGRIGLVLTGTLGFDAWAAVLILSAEHGVPAIAAAAVLVGVDAVALGIVLTRVGTEDLDRSKYYFATGMLGILFVWDIPVEFSVPGILLVAAIFAYLLYRLGRTLDQRESTTVPPGARGAGS